MFALAATNAVSVLLFGTLYAVAGAGRLSPGAFLVCLGALFVLATALWVRVESRHRAFEPLRRLGRVAAGLMAIVIGTPMLVLMPLFWLDTQLPVEAGLHQLLAPIMTLVLISLILVVLVNVAGAAVATGLAVASRARATQRS